MASGECTDDECAYKNRGQDLVKTLHMLCSNASDSPLARDLRIAGDIELAIKQIRHAVVAIGWLRDKGITEQ
jgi:hypothetical protein